MIGEGVRDNRSMQMDKPFLKEVQTCENVSLESPFLGQQCLRRPRNTGTRLLNDGTMKDRTRRRHS